ncbi:MAG: hypothetical protein QM731_24940 [Chitinophagaceae bacterium]
MIRKRLMYCMAMQAIIAGALTGCDSSSGAHHKQHAVEISMNGSLLYADRINNGQVMTKGTDNNHFVSFRIGFKDSVQVDKKFEKERGVYFDFNMGNDWKALINGDSVAPVFYHPMPGLNNMEKQGMLVFEVPEGLHPDTLVYNDSFGQWNKQIIVFNGNSK